MCRGDDLAKAGFFYLNQRDNCRWEIFQTNISLQLPVPVPVPVLCHYSSPYRHLHCDTLTCGTLCQVCILRELCGGLGRGGRSNGGTQVGAEWLIDFIFLNSGLQNASLIHWLNNFIELSLFYFRKLFPLCGFVLGLDVGNVTIESGNNTHLKGTVQRDFRFPIFSSFQPAWATDQWDKIWSLQSLPVSNSPKYDSAQSCDLSGSNLKQRDSSTRFSICFWHN